MGDGTRRKPQGGCDLKREKPVVSWETQAPRRWALMTRRQGGPQPPPPPKHPASRWGWFWMSSLTGGRSPPRRAELWAYSPPSLLKRGVADSLETPPPAAPTHHLPTPTRGSGLAVTGTPHVLAEGTQLRNKVKSLDSLSLSPLPLSVGGRSAGGPCSGTGAPPALGGPTVKGSEGLGPRRPHRGGHCSPRWAEPAPPPSLGGLSGDRLAPDLGPPVTWRQRSSSREERPEACIGDPLS